MKRLLALLCAAPLACLAQAPAQEPQYNLVTLSAQAERDVPNDLLSAVLAAEAEGPDPAPLAATVNRTMQAALDTAKSYRNVRVRSGAYQSTPVYDKNRVVRWRLRQELRLESSDIAAAAELIGRLQASLTVAGMNLSVSPEARRQAENSLIGEALAAFEERARLVRDAMKAKGYRLRDTSISGGGPIVRPVFAMARGGAEAMAAPAIEAGSSRILITVSGTIQLQ
jgi:predicted secreted protein